MAGIVEHLDSVRERKDAGFFQPNQILVRILALHVLNLVPVVIIDVLEDVLERAV